MSFRIVPLVTGSGPVIALYRPVLLIGRHPECDIRLDGRKISRRHCCVATAYDRVLIRDLGSRNGVHINGRIPRGIEACCGRPLAIGPILFRREEEGGKPGGRVSPGGHGISGRPVPVPVPSKVPPVATAPKRDSDFDLIPIDDI